jgi:hypothetical protein
MRPPSPARSSIRQVASLRSVRGTDHDDHSRLTRAGDQVYGRASESSELMTSGRSRDRHMPGVDESELVDDTCDLRHHDPVALSTTRIQI